ncbi:hypothetical protein V1504DRAFT_436162 [Lipomyces starkeyi]
MTTDGSPSVSDSPRTVILQTGSDIFSRDQVARALKLAIYEEALEIPFDKHQYLEDNTGTEEECREMSITVDWLLESGQESAANDFLNAYFSTTEMDLRKSLLKLAVHASQKYYLYKRARYRAHETKF